MGGTELGVE
jgi:hypothetical protein